MNLMHMDRGEEDAVGIYLMYMKPEERQPTLLGTYLLKKKNKEGSIYSDVNTDRKKATVLNTNRSWGGKQRTGTCPQSVAWLVAQNVCATSDSVLS